jgi:hypothetical protein
MVTILNDDEKLDNGIREETRKMTDTRKRKLKQMALKDSTGWL